MQNTTDTLTALITEYGTAHNNGAPIITLPQTISIPSHPVPIAYLTIDDDAQAIDTNGLTLTCETLTSDDILSLIAYLQRT